MGDASSPMRSYLDHAATSSLRPAAAHAFQQASGLVGNASGLHTSARQARARLEDARDSIAADLGAHPSEVVFTSGGSEADSLAILGGRLAHPDAQTVVISAVEHPAVLTAAHSPHLIPADQVRVVAVDHEGIVDLDQAAAAIDDRVGLVSVQTVNNEQGTRQPVDQLAELAHRRAALMHTDAVQAVLWPGIDFSTSPTDLVSLSGHKVGAPAGIGVLLARRSAAVKTTGLGGGQERQFRSGTPAVALAAALAAALHDTVTSRESELSRITHLGQRVRQIVTSSGARLNGPARRDVALVGELAHPGIISATWPALRADDLLLLLDRAGIDASVGSACRAGVHQPSDVVLACGGSEVEALATVRFSLGHTTTEIEIDHLARVLPGAVEAASSAF